MKNLSGVYDNNRNDEGISGGYGTGFAPPTQKDDETMIGSLFIIDNITSPTPLFDSYE